LAICVSPLRFASYPQIMHKMISCSGFDSCARRENNEMRRSSFKISLKKY
jgi:hypothetical protein